ncbi:hypothetical protein OG814_32320 [Streptomyces zaomyceticus]|uniref:Uncharacterized protein n=1 Tax=Streptomyces zaomyceticus TaxID=68286 RepID=A0ABZ1LN17_9ACTN
MANLAIPYGADVEIYSWADGLVWADGRTDLPATADHVLRSCGFTAPADPGNPAYYSLESHIVGPDRQLAASSAASQLTGLGYRVAIDPNLVVGYVGETVDTDARRLATARQVSPVAAKSNSSAPPPPSPARPAPRSR